VCCLLYTAPKSALHWRLKWRLFYICSTLSAKYGLPLKNLDHFPQMKKRRPWTYFTYKFGPVAYLGGLFRFLETIQVRTFSSTQCTSLIPGGTACYICFRVISYIAQLFLWTLRKANWHTDENQSLSFLNMPLWAPLMSLVVTSWPLTSTDLTGCGWSTVGTNFSEWVQIFQKNLFSLVETPSVSIVTEVDLFTYGNGSLIIDNTVRTWMWNGMHYG